MIHAVKKQAETGIEGVVGNSEAVYALQQAVHQLMLYDERSRKHPLEEYGFAKHFLLYGKPGTGKTTIIKEVADYASELAESLGKSLHIKKLTHLFKSSYYSKSGHQLSAIFREAALGKGTYLIIAEDIDTLFFDRGNSFEEDNANLGILLNGLEGMEKEKWNYLFVASANRMVDPALLERLKEGMYIVKGPESNDDYFRMLKIHLEKWDVDCTKAAKVLAEKQVSGRGVKNICRSIKNRAVHISQEDVITGKFSVGRISEKDIIDAIEAYVSLG